MKKTILILNLLFFYKGTIAQNWQQFSDSTINIYHFYLDSTSNTLYSTGAFVQQNGDTIVSPAYWNGVKWVTIGNFNFRFAGPFPTALIKYDGALYVGGGFLRVTGAPGNAILKLDSVSNTWDTLDFSPDADVRCFFEYNASLYIGGMFSHVGPLYSRGLVTRYGPWWSTIPPLLWIGRVESLVNYNGMLVIGGAFNADITLTYKGCVIGWDGFGFIPMADGLELTEVPYPIVLDMEVYNNKLYAGGIFRTVNIIDGYRIVSWDGNTWSGVGGGVNFDVTSLQVYNGELYIAGGFTLAGGILADHIAKWDGIKWCSLGSYFNGTISDMCVYNNELIVAGNFTEIDGQPMQHIAKWVGGNYTDSCQVVGIEEMDIQKHISVFPSPAKETLNIRSDKFIINKIKITDLAGKNIFSKENSITNFQLNISFLPSGLYFLILETKEGRVVKKFVKE